MSDRSAVIVSRRLTAEDCYRIDTAFLMHHGLLDPRRPAQMDWEWTTELGHRAVRAVWDPDARSLELRTSGEAPRMVRVEHQVHGSGQRVYLVCPVRHKRCAALFLNNNILASLKAHKLKYLSEARSLVEKRALRARDLIDKPYTPFCPAVVKGGQPFVIKQPVKTKRPGRYERFSTRHALKVTYFPVQTLRDLLARRVVELSPELQLAARTEDPLPMCPKGPFSTNVYEAHPRLETAGLSEAELLLDGRATTAFAAWNSEFPPVPFSAMFVNCIDPAFPFVAVLTGREACSSGPATAASG